MKTKHLYSIILASIMMLQAFSQQPNSPNQKNSADQSVPELPKGVTSDWYAQAVGHAKQAEYAFYPAKEAQGFRTTNSHNRLGFLIQPGGYAVYNIAPKAGDKEWSARFSIRGIGRKNPSASFDNVFSTVKSASMLEYRSSSLDVQYINNEEGLRQNFIVKQKPAGDGDLHATLQIESALAAEVKENRLFLYTAGNKKDVKLVYDGLKVWDANHTPLAASMQLDKETNSLAIRVDDSNATYPITIDPLNRVPEWMTSADGVLPALLTNLQLQVQSLYGYTVTGLGDINGDGFDDVAVGAPSMADVVSGTGSLTGVGAVFIYLGSPSGLPATPSKVLQPTTAVDGALFGFSIDAGDMTGDGRPDIAIGAPLDSYQTTAAGLLGPVSVNVRAGKVYIYRSEDLFSASNPSPFLQVRLQGVDFFSTGVLNLLLSNVSVNALFGYSVSVTQDLNGDGRADLLIGSPAYLGIDLLSVQSGAAFVYYSSALGTTSPLQLQPPDLNLLGVLNLPLANTSGLLFGFSIDGAGDFNNDGIRDVVVGAPAGVDLSSLGGLFTGQVLGGSAYIYYGLPGNAGINPVSNTKLQASASGLLGSAANLFGYKVKGAENGFGGKTGNVLIGAPAGSVLSNVLNGLRVKAGELHVFRRKTPGASGTFVSDQALTSPRSTSILSILAGQNINLSVLYASSFDNMLDLNCDNIGDLIVGEPLSSSLDLIGLDAVGGGAYVYVGRPDGTYNPTPIWNLNNEVSPLVGVNATSLVGFSVANAGYIRGRTQGVRSIVAGPSNSLDFGTGLLNLNNTLNTLFSFTFDNNGLGKSYSYSNGANCNITLPTNLTVFEGRAVSKTVELDWTALTEDGLNFYQLERSIDGVTYEPLAVVFAKNGARNDYDYTDKHPYAGMNYYRLKMVDKDTRFSYSNIVAVKFSEKLPGDIVVAPNPVQNDIHVRMTGLEKGVYKVELVNSAGQSFFVKPVTVNRYDQTETITRNGSMSSGIYWLNVYDHTNNRVKSLRILLIKN